MLEHHSEARLPVVRQTSNPTMVMSAQIATKPDPLS
jgi:hypothetical protein